MTSPGLIPAASNIFNMALCVYSPIKGSPSKSAMAHWNAAYPFSPEP
eukprot:CAMPEP_0168819986 /NCGR_PEP_ID=MMETSP0726-20121227/8592_1 /TAXON_ID=265536 /ORGANISM="Amphiprora sp., Strain CCMP467" /LENGTH=46 /DNA_ID= /DNA_START= /DNA_END= /DNA_ORIENTATION=